MNKSEDSLVFKTSTKLQKLIKNDTDTTMNCAVDQQDRSKILEISLHICCQASVGDRPNKGKVNLQNLVLEQCERLRKRNKVGLLFTIKKSTQNE